MTQIGDDEFTQQREPVSGAAIKNAWVQTTEDLSALEHQRQENGWDTVAIPALQTAAVSRDAGKKHDDRYGLFFVIADNHADSFTNAFERGEFPRYEAYRNEVDGAVFLVVELLDPKSETAILLAGQYERRHVPGMVAAATEEGELYTHVRTLDKTVLGSFKHDEYAPLVPGPGSVGVDSNT